ncbi:MAG TPA: hypothetical protein VF832_17915 [Longimicrobiales bacterium]
MSIDAVIVALDLAIVAGLLAGLVLRARGERGALHARKAQIEVTHDA